MKNTKSLQARETERIRQFYEKIVGEYDHWLRHYEKIMGLGDVRKRLLSHAHGRTLELGVGTGVNLAHYPPNVQLTGIDLTPEMLAASRQRAQELGLDVEFLIGDAQSLDLPDNHFDTVVTTLLMSTIPNDRQAATEIRRVLKPGGKLLLLDHVRSPIAPVRWMERVINFYTARFARFHLLRDPLDYLGDIGFSIEHCERSRWGIIESLVARAS
jgi:ubiquinone/menaquinone biosynthesis C-methylase UbiE